MKITCMPPYRDKMYAAEEVSQAWLLWGVELDTSSSKCIFCCAGSEPEPPRGRRLSCWLLATLGDVPASPCNGEPLIPPA